MSRASTLHRFMGYGNGDSIVMCPWCWEEGTHTIMSKGRSTAGYIFVCSYSPDKHYMYSKNGSADKTYSPDIERKSKEVYDGRTDC
jgi:hypothetical protein